MPVRLPSLVVLALLTTLSAAATAPASAALQPLADRVPDDAMVYIGWRGSDNLGDPYQQSHLKAVLDATDWPQLFTQFLPALTAKVGQRAPDAAEAMRLASTIASPLWHHESAFYFGGLIAGQRNGPPSPKLALLVRAGDDAPALVKQLNDVLARAGQTPFPIKVASYGGLVAVTTGSWPAFDALLGAQNQAPPAPALAHNPKFTAAMAQVHTDPVAAAYVDAEAIVKMVDGFVALGAQPQQQQLWHRARQILGLSSVRQLALTGAFDGKDWACDAFLAAPAPRHGLFAMMDGAPLSDDILKLVPQDATLASAAHADLAHAVAQAKAAVNEAAPDWAQTLDQYIARANQWAGIDLERDLLAPLGDQWALYASPQVGGNGFLGLSIVNRPRDPQKLETSLGILEKRITDTIQRQTRGQATVAFKTSQRGDLTLHYLALPFVTPTYAITNGTLYVALYPQVVLSAARYAQHNGPSILQNDKFTSLRKRLTAADANHPVSSISFADLPRTAPNAYSSWLLLTRYIGFADLFGVDSPLMLMPPIDQLLPQLAPSGRISWTDDAGWHAKGVTPFPGADALAQDPLGSLMTAQPALMASILLPSLNRAREAANRVKAASNLRQIGQGMLLYANEHRGRYPATLGELSLSEPLAPDVFVSPSSNTTPPHQALDKEKLAEWVNENADFVYLGSGKTVRSAGANDILAYEKPDIHGPDGFNVLYGDGHVEFVPRARGLQLIHDAQQAKPKQPQ